MQISSFEDYKKIEKDKLPVKGSFIALGVTAFMRYFVARFLPNFNIICYKNSLDNELIKEYANVFSLKKRKPSVKLKHTNTNNLLLNKSARSFITTLPKPRHLFVYKMNKNIDRNIKGLGISKKIAVTSKLNKIYENKASFRDIMRKAGVKPIEGRVYTLKQFLKEDYTSLAEKYGNSFVIQMPDFLLGGGKGTLFINNKKDFEEYKENIIDGIYNNKKITKVNVTRFVKGTSCSVAACATQYGTLVSSLQQQLIDIPEVIQMEKGSGLFVGHVFGKDVSNSIQSQAQLITKKLGAYMYKHGYRGIFGIDMIVDEESNTVYPVECNARYTGAFPMISMLHISQEIIPLDLFHFLEHLKLPYELDYERVQKLYNKKINGSHIVLSNHKDKERVVRKDLPAGLYSFDKKTNKLHFIKSTLDYSDITKNNECIICDGNPSKGMIIGKYSSVARICHVLFKDSIVNESNSLKQQPRDMVRAIYEHVFGSNYTQK